MMDDSGTDAEVAPLRWRQGRQDEGVHPSVVYLNGLTVNAALAELGAWISGARTPARWLDIDLMGTAASPSTQIGPRRVPARDPGCIDCGNAA
jgi:hypothetical protein